jgi:hypothetical protein
MNAFLVFSEYTSMITLTCPFYHGVITPSGPRPPHYRGFIITLHVLTVFNKYMIIDAYTSYIQ